MNIPTYDEFEGIPQQDYAVFPVEEYRLRVEKVRRGMRERGIELQLVTSPENIYYLTGYRTTGYYVFQILLLPLEGDPVFVVRHLEMPNVKGLSWAKSCVALHDSESKVDGTVRAVIDIGGAEATIGYEENGLFLPVSVVRGIESRLNRARVVADDGLVEEARRVKSEREIAYIRKAGGIAVIGLQAGIDALADGVTENHVAGAVYKAMMDAGGESPAGGPYVIAGARGELSHQFAERHPIQRGRTVFFEIGGCYFRYGASVLRIACLGSPPEEMRKASITVRDTLEALIDFIRPGVTSAQVDHAGRSVMEAGGYGKYWLARAGYSMGIAFAPGWGEGMVMDLKRDDPRVLEPGMVFHLVPSLHLPRLGAMSISETVLVTEDGCEVLTPFERGLIVR